MSWLSSRIVRSIFLHERGSKVCGLQATLTKGHAREGSFINKSLLTLGTVIGKLSDGNAVHIPFRDSKLTRLLQSSMTGSAARISVIATATPASCQAEETHNTLKFATRAKKVRRCTGAPKANLESLPYQQ